MINLGESIFELAERTLNKTRRVYSFVDVIDLSVKIRYQLDRIEQTKKARETKLRKNNL